MLKLKIIAATTINRKNNFNGGTSANKAIFLVKIAIDTDKVAKKQYINLFENI